MLLHISTTIVVLEEKEINMKNGQPECIPQSMILDANQNRVWKEPCADPLAPPARCLIQLLLAHFGCPPAVSWTAPNMWCNSSWA